MNPTFHWIINIARNNARVKNHIIQQDFLKSLSESLKIPKIKIFEVFHALIDGKWVQSPLTKEILEHMHSFCLRQFTSDEENYLICPNSEQGKWLKSTFVEPIFKYGFMQNHHALPYCLSILRTACQLHDLTLLDEAEKHCRHLVVDGRLFNFTDELECKVLLHYFMLLKTEHLEVCHYPKYFSRLFQLHKPSIMHVTQQTLTYLTARHFCYDSRWKTTCDAIFLKITDEPVRRRLLSNSDLRLEYLDFSIKVLARESVTWILCEKCANLCEQYKWDEKVNTWRRLNLKYYVDLYLNTVVKLFTSWMKEPRQEIKYATQRKCLYNFFTKVKKCFELHNNLQYLNEFMMLGNMLPQNKRAALMYDQMVKLLTTAPNKLPFAQQPLLHREDVPQQLPGNHPIHPRPTSLPSNQQTSTSSQQPLNRSLTPQNLSSSRPLYTPPAQRPLSKGNFPPKLGIVQPTMSSASQLSPVAMQLLRRNSAAALRSQQQGCQAIGTRSLPATRRNDFEAIKIPDNKLWTPASTSPLPTAGSPLPTMLPGVYGKTGSPQGTPVPRPIKFPQTGRTDPAALEGISRTPPPQQQQPHDVQMIKCPKCGMEFDNGVRKSYACPRCFHNCFTAFHLPSQIRAEREQKEKEAEEEAKRLSGKKQRKRRKRKTIEQEEEAKKEKKVPKLKIKLTPNMKESKRRKMKKLASAKSTEDQPVEVLAGSSGGKRARSVERKFSSNSMERDSDSDALVIDVSDFDSPEKKKRRSSEGKKSLDERKDT